MGQNRKNFNCKDNLLAKIMDDRVKKINTAMICKVTSVNVGERTVCILPMAQMNDLNNNPVNHEVVNDIPYTRIQAGSYGIICDPVVEDIGLVVFCSRDVSNVIKNKKVTTTGSKRSYSISDGIYVASLLLDEPESYLKFEKDKISVETKDINISNETTEINSLATIKVASKAITVTAPSINIISDTVTVSGEIIAKDVKTANGISLQNHIHGNGNNGDDTTKPQS